MSTRDEYIASLKELERKRRLYAENGYSEEESREYTDLLHKIGRLEMTLLLEDSDLA